MLYCRDFCLLRSSDPFILKNIKIIFISFKKSRKKPNVFNGASYERTEIHFEILYAPSYTKIKKSMDLSTMNNAYFENSKNYLFFSFSCSLELKEFSNAIFHAVRIYH